MADLPQQGESVPDLELTTESREHIGTEELRGQMIVLYRGSGSAIGRLRMSSGWGGRAVSERKWVGQPRRYCTNCGAEAGQGDRFCVSYGRSLAAGPPIQGKQEQDPCQGQIDAGPRRPGRIALPHAPVPVPPHRAIGARGSSSWSSSS